MTTKVHTTVQGRQEMEWGGGVLSREDWTLSVGVGVLRRDFEVGGNKPG